MKLKVCKSVGNYLHLVCDFPSSKALSEDGGKGRAATLKTSGICISALPPSQIGSLGGVWVKQPGRGVAND